jgi:chromosome segregation ATPase
MANTPKSEKSDRQMFTPPSALSMSSGIHGRSLSGSLKNEIEEKQKLEKENFDLKMKIYYLEDNLRQSAEGTAGNEVDELRSENASLRLRLEEKELDLEQRNHLLIKAKSAIESLKSELDKMKIQFNDKVSREKELQHQIKSLSDQGVGSDTEYQDEINSLHSTISAKNDELHHLHLDLVSGFSSALFLCSCYNMHGTVFIDLRRHSDRLPIGPL